MADLDHRFVAPPYLRLTDRRKTSAGLVFVWHLRVAQPNIAQISTDTVHSLEHFIGDYLYNTSDDIITVAPMGCQTGFYIATSIEDYDELATLLAGVLERVLEADAVPHADPVHCGWAANHSLGGAQIAAAWLLGRQAEWADPGPDAREV
ncbi:S-ribosylhomocysteine lyase [Amycolatopsis nigrescens]|uniref:S-ribosylhomocysteine lyase n=1 Tax=Amycolatopsis nigrescens TaxID=381445 RepID=UPI00037FF122|nr:S-ribosylhomocysteine lyase [Amycolatopsis nigrescens]